MITIRLLEDCDSAHLLHDLAFPTDDWVGDDHTFWVARDTDRENSVVGFASAIYRPEAAVPYVFLSRCAVIRRAQRSGLHCRLIKHRLMWAVFQGAREVHTYTTLQNYPSMVNLLAEGFQFYKHPEPYVGHRVHYFRKQLE